MRQFFNFRPCVRLYHTSASDPNIKVAESGVIAQLKEALYRRKQCTPDLCRFEQILEHNRSKMTLGETVEAGYLLSRLTRQKGGIIDSCITRRLLDQIMRSASSLSRSEALRCIQLCSLLVNRNKVTSGSHKHSSVVNVRDEVVEACIEHIRGKLDDLPPTSLSILASALARQYRNSFDGLFKEISDEVAHRIDPLLSHRIDSVTHLRIRLDLYRSVPYLLLALSQTGQNGSPRLCEKALELFTLHRLEIPYEFISLFLYAFPRSQDNSKLEGLFEYVSALPVGDLSLTDHCIICLGARRLSSNLFRLVSREFKCDLLNRKTSEFNIHVLRDLSAILCDPEFSRKNIRSRYFVEINKKSSELPAGYIVDIFDNILKWKDVPLNSVDRFVDRLVIPSLRRMGENDIRRTLTLSEKIGHLNERIRSALDRLKISV